MDPLKRLVWLAVLSYLTPPITTMDMSADECEVALSVANGACAAAGVIAGVGGGLLCAVTFGIGCAVAVAGGIAASSCVVAAERVNCDELAGQGPADMVNYMKDIQSSISDTQAQIDLGFFEQKYNDDMNVIRKALDRYDRDVIEKSSWNGKKGFIITSNLVRDWMDDILGDGAYNVRGALDMLEDMVEGRTSLTRTPSVYELASKQDICSLDLYNFVTNLLTGGSSLVFVALEMKGYGVDQVDKDELKDRLILNREMFEENCRQILKYKVVIKTSTESSADTDDWVHLVLVGTKGNTEPLGLDVKNKDDMMIGATDTHILKLKNVGEVKCLDFKLAGNDGWNIEWVKVYESGGLIFDSGELKVWLDDWASKKFCNILEPGQLILKSASMKNSWGAYPPKNLINGRLDDFAHSSGTSGGMWLQVHLAKRSNINKVVVFNRKSCCQERIVGFSVLIKYKGNTVTNCGVINGEQDSYPFNCKGNGDVVELYKAGYVGSQNVAEIKVYGAAA